MLIRAGLYTLLLTLLIALGGWVFYKDLQPPSLGGFRFLDGLIAAMYWFTFLIYLFFSVLLSYSLRGRTWKSVILAHILSMVVAVSITLFVLSLGKQQAAKEGRMESSISSAGLSTQHPADQVAGKDRDDLNVQSLIPLDDN